MGPPTVSPMGSPRGVTPQHPPPMSSMGSLHSIPPSVTRGVTQCHLWGDPMGNAVGWHCVTPWRHPTASPPNVTHRVTQWGHPQHHLFPPPPPLRTVTHGPPPPVPPPHPCTPSPMGSPRDRPHPPTAPSPPPTPPLWVPPHLQALAGVVGGPHAVRQPQHPVLSVAAQRLRPHLPLQQHPWVSPTHPDTHWRPEPPLPPLGAPPQPRIPTATHPHLYGYPSDDAQRVPTHSHGNPKGGDPRLAPPNPHPQGSMGDHETPPGDCGTWVSWSGGCWWGCGGGQYGGPSKVTGCWGGIGVLRVPVGCWGGGMGIVGGTEGRRGLLGGSMGVPERCHSAGGGGGGTGGLGGLRC